MSSLKCSAVKSADDEGCARPVVVGGQTGLLASVVTEESRTGSSQCPWLIRVDPGQTITLTLIDFGLSYTPGYHYHDHVLSLYARIVKAR